MATDKIAEYVEKFGRIRFDERLRKDINFKKYFSNELINKFITRSEIKNIFDDKVNLLLSLGVAKQIGEKIYFTNAGVLFFTSDPSLFIQQAKITCVAYNGIEKVDILDRKDFNLDIISSVEEGLSFLRRHLNEASDIKKLKRKENLEIPLIALREALVNAVAHRDYLEAGARIVIEIFSDRVIISNPGGLPAGLSVKDFGKYSLSRNPIISDLLYRVGFIEKLGTGVNRIRSILKKMRHADAVFEFNDFFAVTFYRKKQSAINFKGGQKGGLKGGLNSEELLTPKLKVVLTLISKNPKISRAEISNQLNINTSAIQKHIESLKKKGFIERVGSAKNGHWKIKVQKN